jgi:hypothetical protein
MRQMVVHQPRPRHGRAKTHPYRLPLGPEEPNKPAHQWGKPQFLFVRQVRSGQNRLARPREETRGAAVIRTELSRRHHVGRF